jgi:L-ascorbate metabolism protein UlaG (beta-lactamase superfamily)
MADEISYRYNHHLPFVKETKGNPFIKGQFTFGGSVEPIPRSKLFRWMMTPNPKRAEKLQDNWRPEVKTGQNFVADVQPKIVWLGHASFYICTGKYKILTDPVFFDLAPMLRRRHRLPLSPSAFVGIDYIILSHGHRDHLDIPSMKQLVRQNPNVTVLCPLGFDDMLRDIGFINIQEAAWYQQYLLPDDLKVVFLPAKHWNRRWLTDYNTTLWGSHWIEWEGRTVYFAGDTGMASHFDDIRSVMGTPDYCLMPVGAYLPRFVMEWAHIAPWEALEAFHILKGKYFIPMHYGTFDLSDEPASEPMRLLRSYEKEGKFEDKTLLLPAVGEIISLK